MIPRLCHSSHSIIWLPFVYSNLPSFAGRPTPFLSAPCRVLCLCLLCPWCAQPFLFGTNSPMPTCLFNPNSAFQDALLALIPDDFIICQHLHIPEAPSLFPSVATLKYSALYFDGAPWIHLRLKQNVLYWLDFLCTVSLAVFNIEYVMSK